MDGITCDMCGKELLTDEDTRYIVKIQVYAAYDPMELTAEDVAADRSEELALLLRRVAEMDAEELQDQVARCFQFDLCPGCQRKYLAAPLPGCRVSTGPAADDPGGGPSDLGQDSVTQR